MDVAAAPSTSTAGSRYSMIGTDEMVTTQEKTDSFLTFVTAFEKGPAYTYAVVRCEAVRSEDDGAGDGAGEVADVVFVDVMNSETPCSRAASSRAATFVATTPARAVPGRPPLPAFFFPFPAPPFFFFPFPVPFLSSCRLI